MLVVHTHSCTGLQFAMCLVIHILDCVFPEDLFHSLSRDGVESDQPVVTWILFFAFLEDRLEIYTQASGTFSHCHDLS